MRIAHIADTHIGYRALPNVVTSYGKNLRTDDTERAFCQAIQQIIEQHRRNPIDLFIHAGDIFDRPRPTWADLLVVAGAIRELKAAGICQVWIAGNHDMSRIPMSETPLTMLRELFQDTDCYMAVQRDRQAVVFPFAYVELHPWEWIERGPAVQISGATERPDVPRILVAHGCRAELDRWANFEGRELDTWDYIALGHIHYHEWAALGLKNAHYPGATERFGWRDAGSVPGWMLVTLDEDGIEGGERFTLKTRPFIDLGQIDGEGFTDGELIDQVIHGQLRDLVGNLQPYEALARVCLTGINRQHQSRLREKLAATAERFTLAAHLQVDFLNQGYRYEAPELSVTPEHFDLTELFRQFVDQMDDDLSGFLDRFRERGLAALDRAKELDGAETAGKVD